jgi:hypothetical protein
MLVSVNKAHRNLVKINNMILTPVKKDLYEAILSNLYQRLNLQQVRYQMLQDHSQLSEIQHGKHYVTYHMQGFNFLLFMTMVGGRPFHCLISKRELRSHPAKNQQDDIKIYTFNMRYPRINYYSDTLLDGKILRTDGEPMFLVYDAYCMCGQDVHGTPMEEKYAMIDGALKDINANMQQDMKVRMLRLMPVEDIGKMFYEKVRNSAMKINGFVFLPERSGKFFIYVNDEEFNHVRTPVKQEPAVPRTQITGSQHEFRMKKTHLPDVYELFDGDAREGLAHIPNIHISHHCRELLRDRDECRITCVRSVKFNKWVPLVQDLKELSAVLF